MYLGFALNPQSHIELVYFFLKLTRIFYILLHYIDLVLLITLHIFINNKTLS